MSKPPPLNVCTDVFSGDGDVNIVLSFKDLSYFENKSSEGSDETEQMRWRACAFVAGQCITC